jgi:hypothetical protein
MTQNMRITYDTFDWEKYKNDNADIQINNKKEAYHHWSKTLKKNNNTSGYNMSRNILTDLIIQFNKYFDNFNVVDANKIIDDINVKMLINKKNNALQNKYSYNKIIILYACHIVDELKYYNVMNNLQYLHGDIIIINSKGYTYGTSIYDQYKHLIKEYYEIENDPRVDIYKWMYALKNCDLSEYDNIIFINDSIVINDNITHFFNLCIETNADLYGFNDSLEIKYHYQSYLFCIKQKSINLLIDYIDKMYDKITNYDDVVKYVELELTNVYDSHDCFLTISKPAKNIHMANNNLYKILYQYKLLPLIKIKKFTQLRLHK